MQVHTRATDKTPAKGTKTVRLPAGTVLPQAALPSNAPAQAASALVQAAAALVATATPTNAQGTPSAALRGLPAKVALGDQPYKSKAVHNVHWWNNVVAAVKVGKGVADVAKLLAGAHQSVAGNYAQATGAPGHFLGYAVRKGYLKAVA